MAEPVGLANSSCARGNLAGGPALAQSYERDLAEGVSRTVSWAVPFCGTVKFQWPGCAENRSWPDRGPWWSNLGPCRLGPLGKRHHARAFGTDRRLFACLCRPLQASPGGAGATNNRAVRAPPPGRWTSGGTCECAYQSLCSLVGSSSKQAKHSPQPGCTAWPRLAEVERSIVGLP